MSRYLREIVTEIRRLGFKDVRIVTGRRHPKIKATFRNRTISYSCAATPSDCNAGKMLIRDFKRFMSGK